MDIKQAKKLFDTLDKEFTKIYALKDYEKYGDMHKYNHILNLILVFLGIRPMAFLTIRTGPVSELIETLFGSNPELKIISKKMGDKSSTGKKIEHIYFANLEEIKRKGLGEELQLLIDGDIDHKSLGKLLDYACPSDISLEMDNYIKRNDDELRRRFTISYIIYKKSNKEIMFSPKGQLVSYICYSDKKKEYFYKDALKRLKLYQKILAQLTDKLHIGLEFTEEIV